MGDHAPFYVKHKALANLNSYVHFPVEIHYCSQLLSLQLYFVRGHCPHSCRGSCPHCPRASSPPMKSHLEFTPGGAETGISAGEGEGQEYEQMDTGEGGVSDPTYMEVHGRKGQKIISTSTE